MEANNPAKEPQGKRKRRRKKKGEEAKKHADAQDYIFTNYDPDQDPIDPMVRLRGRWNRRLRRLRERLGLGQPDSLLDWREVD